MQHIHAADTDKIKYTGRVDITEDYAGINWSFSGFEFRGWMDGDIIINYTHMGGYSAYIRVLIDGQPTEKLEIAQQSTSLLLGSVEKGYHTVRVIKTSEPGNSIIRLHSVEFNGTPDARPEDSELRIEFIGDSITCGAGILTNETDPPDDVYERAEDAYLSFAALASEALNADASFVALSGWGVVQGGDNKQANIPSVYEYTNGLWDNRTKWDFDSHPSDIVVISLGTNDYMLASEPKVFLDGAVSFAARVRELNPDAVIIWTYGQISKSFSSSLQTALASLGDNRLFYLEMPSDSSAGWGHPGRAAHERYADILLSRIAQLTG
ncbi:MAG: GDSL-type esterase/lipase family protein [Firmicutes bacterium]|nr:GDSL-type esterase/lipase family protein [Bacillota bacterium]